jgi:hypothetical protein
MYRFNIRCDTVFCAATNTVLKQKTNVVYDKCHTVNEIKT